MFRWIDRLGKGEIGSLEIRKFLKENGIHPEKEQLYLVVKKYDYDADGKWKYSDFAESFAPRAKEYFKMLKHRESVNADLKFTLE